MVLRQVLGKGETRLGGAPLERRLPYPVDNGEHSLASVNLSMNILETGVEKEKGLSSKLGPNYEKSDVLSSGTVFEAERRLSLESR